MNNEEKKAVNEIDFHIPKKKGKKAQRFLVLDCETATLPFVFYKTKPSSKLYTILICFPQYMLITLLLPNMNLR